MDQKCTSIRLLQIHKTKRPILRLPSLPHPPSVIPVSNLLKSPYLSEVGPTRASSNSRNTTYIQDTTPNIAKTLTSNSFCLNNIKLRNNSSNSKSKSRMRPIKSKEDSDPYICINTMATCKKYKVIERKIEINDMDSPDKVIDDINKQLYQSRYTIYINNHNILNGIKSFISEHMGMLTNEQLPTLLKLVDDYTDIITKEESFNTVV